MVQGLTVLTSALSVDNLTGIMLKEHKLVWSLIGWFLLETLLSFFLVRDLTWDGSWLISGSAFSGHSWET